MRWPMHPQPYPMEALSSWFRRLARANQARRVDLFRDLGVQSDQSEFWLDLEPPEQFVADLSSKTGVPLDDIMRMTCKPMLPNVTETSGDDWHTAYVGKHSILYPAEFAQRGNAGDAWRPWFSRKRFEQPWACPMCMDGNDRYLRIHWRLPVTGTCPAHKLYLVPQSDIGIIKLGPKPKLRVVPLPLLEQDEEFERAVQTGVFRLPSRTVAVSSWLRLLRTLLEELNAVVSYNYRELEVVRRVWHWVDYPVRAGNGHTTAFEDMRPDRHTPYLEAAAMAAALIRAESRSGLGADARLFQAADGEPCLRETAFLPFDGLWSRPRAQLSLIH